jgi:small conductance mechanosensitive channel
MLRDLLAGYPGWVAGAILVAAVLALASAASEVTARLVRGMLARFLRTEAGDTVVLPSVRRAIRAIRIVVFGVVLIVLLFPALKVAGVHTGVGFEPEAVVSWLLASGARITLIVLLAVLVIRATGSVVRRIEDEVGRGESLDATERAKRLKTLGTMVENVVGTFVAVSALLMVLRELDVDVLPLLTGAGIVGLAIGFGAQTLVKDVITGFFMILENQVRVGDVAVINTVSGVVESIRLRTITLRDGEGTVHVFPNGSITTLANKTKDYSYAVLDIGVSYRENPDRVIDVLRKVGAGMQADPQFTPSILEPLQVFGIESFTDAAMIIKVRFKTLPLRQWDVAREMRRQVKKAFDAEGIEVPLGQRPLYVRQADRDVPSGEDRRSRAADAGPRNSGD